MKSTVILTAALLCVLSPNSFAVEAAASPAQSQPETPVIPADNAGKSEETKGMVESL